MVQVQQLERKQDEAFDRTTAVRVISPQYHNLVWYYTHSRDAEPWTEQEMEQVEEILGKYIEGYETNYWMLHKFSWAYNAKKYTWDLSSYGGTLSEITQKIEQYYTKN